MGPDRIDGMKTTRGRQDVFLWLGGIAFIVILIGAMFGIGHARGWDAQSGYTHNTSATSRYRFTPEPFVQEPGVKGRYGVAADSRWYYWKLPREKVTLYTRLFAWLCYVGHQTLAWIVLYLAQFHKMSEPAPQRYSPCLNKWNYTAFGLHVFFHLLHLVQTHTTYDALAQDVSIASSQGSVIMILVFVLLIEYKDRGLIFLWPANQNDGISRRLRFNQSVYTFIKRYHGYAFAWGGIYTFWYHPMENTWGHAMGFFHTWIIMLQGSLAYTEFHLNKYWRFLIETWVIAHGTLVAMQTGGPEQLGTKLWPMFCFGFLLILCLTTVFGLPFWKRIHWSFRLIPLAVYLPFAIYNYSWIPDAQGRTFVRIKEIIRIPGAFYLGFLYASMLFYVFLRLEKKTIGERGNISGLKKSFYLLTVYCIFAVFVAMGVYVEYVDVQAVILVIMMSFVFVFITGVCIACVLLNQTFDVADGLLLLNKVK